MQGAQRYLLPADEQGGEGNAEEGEGKGLHCIQVQLQGAEEFKAVELIGAGKRREVL